MKLRSMLVALPAMAAAMLGAEAVLAQNESWTEEWAELERFAGDNATVEPREAEERRVVFMGDSITQGWSDASPEFFEGRPWFERGISGQTTPQMLLRFRQDVIELDPSIVVILAGTNDIAMNTGPATNEQIQNNLASMADIAAANDIEVIIASILPVEDYPWRPGLAPAGRIASINTWLEDFCEQNGHIYLDYYSDVVNDRGGMDERYSYDGVHASKAGYTVMEGLVEEAIEEAVPTPRDSDAYRRQNYFLSRKR